MNYTGANRTRSCTDALFFDTGIIINAKGIIENAARFIEEKQLLSAEWWVRFVNQFREQPDSEDSGWRGEYWGKMMRGAALTYSLTRSQKLLGVMTDTVKDMLTAQESSGRISSYRADDELKGWDMWSRKYVLLGMQYFLEINTDIELEKKIIDSMRRQADYLIDRIGTGSDKVRIVHTSKEWLGLNSSSILEPIVRLYNITGEKKYLGFADYIVGEGGIDGDSLIEFALGDEASPSEYPVQKAYEMMSFFEGVLEYYRATGIEKYKTAVINFAERVSEDEITVIGCAGTKSEEFDNAAFRQSEPPRHRLMQETCVTVTWMKLCFQLLTLTGDPKYADLFERSLYNAYLGAFNTNDEKCRDGKNSFARTPGIKPLVLPFDSYSPLTPGTRGIDIGGYKAMSDGSHYGCCACIGSAGIGLVSRTAVMTSEKGVTVNLFFPGEIVTEMPGGNKVTLTVNTDYPKSGIVEIKTQSSEPFELSLRVPDWSKKTAVSVNGSEASVNTGYTAVRVNGDSVVRIELDMRASVIYPKNVENMTDAKYIALRYGPTVLASDARTGVDVTKPVCISPDDDGYIDVKPTAAPYDSIVAFEIEQENGEKLTVTDYSSAGKTWDEKSRFAAWLPVRAL